MSLLVSGSSVPKADSPKHVAETPAKKTSTVNDTVNENNSSSSPVHSSGENSSSDTSLYFIIQNPIINKKNRIK